MMKKIAITLAAMCYLIWGISCTQNQKPAEHGHSHEEEQLHEHEGDGHGHDHGNEEDGLGHDHGEDVQSHEKDGHTNGEEGEHGSTYDVIKIQPQDFQEVIHTSGKIMPAQGDEITLTAVHEGIVVFAGKNLFPGKQISQGELLVTISGKGLVHDNIENTFMDSKSAFETAKANYERAQLLNEDKITSDKELSEIRMTFEKAKNNYEAIKQNYSAGGQKVSATASGFIKDILVTEGQFVNTGQPLLKISKNKRLIVQADVPQRYFPMLKSIQSANFVTVYDKQLYKSEELNGKLISYGKTTGDNSLFTPVYFEVDNIGNLLAGSFVEIYLKTVVAPNCLVIPKSALLEEAGRYYVFAERDESFEKQFLTIDCHDGENFHIAEGLKAGDRIATKNPYQIKLASMSGSLPANSHQH
jgi:RND family efflux transporter MFP subunit